MKRSLALIALGIGITGGAAVDQASDIPSRERIRVVHQDISKWDKNCDGKLTGRERDEFTKEKHKEAADAETAARAAKAASRPPKVPRVKPPLSAEDAQKPVPQGVPKNIEDAAG